MLHCPALRYGADIGEGAQATQSHPEARQDDRFFVALNTFVRPCGLEIEDLNKMNGIRFPLPDAYCKWPPKDIRRERTEFQEVSWPHMDFGRATKGSVTDMVHRYEEPSMQMKSSGPL